MYKVLQTETYKKWFRKLRDDVAKRNITLRIDVGKGYRVYFKNNGKEIIILLVGGSKSSQDVDIKTAKKMAKEY